MGGSERPTRNRKARRASRFHESTQEKWTACGVIGGSPYHSRRPGGLIRLSEAVCNADHVLSDSKGTINQVGLTEKLNGDTIFLSTLLFHSFHFIATSPARRFILISLKLIHSTLANARRQTLKNRPPKY